MKKLLITTYSLFIFFNQVAFAENSDVTPYSRKDRNYEVDPTFSPCVDFYNYVCSKVINDFKLPENRPAIFVFCILKSVPSKIVPTSKILELP